jgi:hypothetical protein
VASSSGKNTLKIAAKGLNRQYAAALVFTREMYYMLDRPKMEETVRQIAALIEQTISVR